jgi:hypothetical protein
MAGGTIGVPLDPSLVCNKIEGHKFVPNIPKSMLVSFLDKNILFYFLFAKNTLFCSIEEDVSSNNKIVPLLHTIHYRLLGKLSTSNQNYMNNGIIKNFCDQRTCFYVGKRVNKYSKVVAHVWVTTAHKGIAPGQVVLVTVVEQFQISASVICIFAESDLAVMESNPEQDKWLDNFYGEFSVDENLYTTKLAFVCGYGAKALPPTGESDPTVLTCHVAIEKASMVNHVRDAVQAKWKLFEFFLIDEVSDFGFSGSPVLSLDGKVQGMLCESAYEGYSWCLKAIVIKMQLQRIYL